MQVNQKILDFFKFIYDRHEIWHKRFKENKIGPWTDDPILRDYYFCNVYRELDKGTLYLKQSIIDNKDLKPDDKLINIFMYRFFNQYNFFKNFLNGPLQAESWNFKELENLFDSKKEEGVKLFSDAYLITQMKADKTYRPKDKHIQCLLTIDQNIVPFIPKWIKELNEAKNPEEVFKLIRSVPMIGPFLAYEIYCDLSYTDLIKFSDDDFVNIGPGAEAGIKILDPEVKVKDMIKYCESLRDIQSEVFFSIGKDWESIAYKQSNSCSPWLSLRNIEHSLCEFRKYTHWKNGKGKKRYYKKVVT